MSTKPPSEPLYEQNCFHCKIVSGILLGSWATHHLVQNDWRRSPNRLFTASGVAFIYALSAFSFYAAYEIRTGKRDDVLIEVRPSYTAQYTQFFRYMSMSEEEKREACLRELAQKEK